jgi:gamma-glutamyltranspeptidase/glutathione hydrolase
MGGNAIEAAIAVASVLAVVYPHMNGIGGDNFWLIYDAKKRQVKSLQACGPAGSLCSPQVYTDRGHPNSIPFRGVLAANTVPGAVDGWFEAYRFSREKLGGSLAFSVLLQPAIFYAESGFPVSYGQYVWTSKNVGPDSASVGHLEEFDGFARTFLKDRGRVYLPGERFHIRELAKSLRIIAEGGSEAFYRGPIAQHICAYLSERGGLLTLSDFQSYQSRWDDPLSTQYRHWRIYNSPLPTQGLPSLQLLRILEHFPIADWGDDSSLYYHAMVEATKEAFRDRDRWIGDPDFHDVPVERLLSKEYTKKVAASIDLSVAKSKGATEPTGGDTIWMGVVDKDGNAVSFNQSLYFDFGSGIVVDGTGVTLQNRGASFSLHRNSVNCLAPGKRPFHTLNPAMA